MDAIPALPPWGGVTAEIAYCITKSSERYEVPELLMHAIISKEGGSAGKCAGNKNGTLDCGLAQINTSWTKYFSKYGISMDEIKNDQCMNVQASAYILKKNYIEKNGDWYNAIMSYNIGPNNWTANRMNIGIRYANDVVIRWRRLDEYATKYKAQINQKYRNELIPK